MKFGLIGCGYWGQKCIRALEGITGCDLAFIADTDLMKLKFYEKQGYRVTQDYGDILQEDDIVGVLVVTPASSHYLVVKDCLKANKHVFVEKPLTASSVEAEELVFLAASKKLKLMTGYVYLFHPAIVYIKRMLDRHELAPPIHFHFQRKNFGPIREDVSVIWDLAPHEISILLYLVGSMPIDVSASGVDIIGHNRPDIASVNFWFENGFSASMDFSWVDPIKMRELTIISRDKMLIFNDLAAEKIKVFNIGYDQAPVSLIVDQKIIVAAVSIPNKEPLREELQNFVECLNNGMEPLVSGRDGLAVVKILENIESVIKINK
ncbi:Gfo/Idh/MocA family oxidoreductase [Candidatus Gottesmanbacteria bacterium]|nr:Gfo/Idh/MocA family oxidoreductase [Candidatus Gottesmanbacteria bacterium]